MVTKYKGYFNGLDCQRYEVRIIPSGETEDAFEEILLAASDPFVVTYNTSKTPFDAVRTSTASISIVNDEYLYNSLSHCAQGTVVELLNITDTANTFTEWIGYLTSKIYDVGYDSCWETFSLEAADCISSLQYIDYKEISGGGVTNLQLIINQICDAAGELDGYYWTISKQTESGGTIITPDMLAISEHNFQTNDTEEYWHLDEVLEEICRYLGFTCLQWRGYMYFIDYQYLEPNNSLKAYKYNKSSNYHKDSTDGDEKTLDDMYEVTANSYKSGGATMSVEPVYNKVIVNANMYAIEDFIPNPFSDEYIVNRINSANTYASVEIPPHANTTSQNHPYNQWYPDGADAWVAQSWAMEKEADDKYIYMMRPYDHKYWESEYTNVLTGTHAPLSPEQKASSSITRDWRGGTLMDLGVVRKEHKAENNPSQWVIPSKMDYTRYICICQKHLNASGNTGVNDKGNNVLVYKLKDGYRSKGKIDDKCFLVLNCSCIFERYDDCNYINPDWCNAQMKRRGTEAGPCVNKLARPKFKIHIGNKGWSTSENKWVAAGSLNDWCAPQMEWDEKKLEYWNKEISILNNVSWQDKVNEEGIKIPLSGIDTTQTIEFQIINPDCSFYANTGNPKHLDQFRNMNSYCWIKDLSLKCVREGESDLGNDSDVIYENEIDDCSINELDDITVKITTFTDKVKPSYSHMIMGSGFLMAIFEESLGNTQEQRPEENIIQKYVHQYQTPTKRFSLPLDIRITPLQKLIGVDIDMPTDGYVQLGSELDYKRAVQTITVIEKTKGNEL